MSWLEDIFKGGTEGILIGVKEVIGTIKADPLEVLKLQAAVTQTEGQISLALVQAQTKINEIEAASNDRFVSRWRPSVGWICVAGLGYATLFQPLAMWVCGNVGITPPPQLDLNILMPMVTGLLGLAGLRTYEKLNK
jgi:hypothetical protein